jgi:hypothetical protein
MDLSVVVRASGFRGAGKLYLAIECGFITDVPNFPHESSDCPFILPWSQSILALQTLAGFDWGAE